MNKEDLMIDKSPMTRTEVFDKLYAAIISGYFKPGDRLVERDLTKLMGVSRTPIREVLRELERLNLVRAEPYKGVIVNEVTIDQANDLYMVRKSIEGLAVRLCVQNINNDILTLLEQNLIEYEEILKTNDLEKMMMLDDAFHSIIHNATNNTILINITHYLKPMISLFRGRSLPIRRLETLNEHKAIFEALKAKDADLAETIIYKHLNTSLQKVQNQL